MALVLAFPNGRDRHQAICLIFETSRPREKKMTIFHERIGIWHDKSFMIPANWVNFRSKELSTEVETETT